MTLTANNDSAIYNGSAQTSKPGYECSVDGLTFTGIEPMAVGTAVDKYSVTFADGTVGKKDTTNNYEIEAVVAGEFEIKPAKVTISADNKSKVYGTEDPAKLTATVEEGTIYNEDFGYTVDRVSGENVGHYASP